MRACLSVSLSPGINLNSSKMTKHCIVGIANVLALQDKFYGISVKLLYYNISHRSDYKDFSHHGVREFLSPCRSYR